jgi:hypothetical protein
MLKIYIKQAIQYNIVGDPIIYNGANPYSLQPVINGTLAANRQWQPYGVYIDVTEYVSDLTQLQLTWTEEKNPAGVTTPGAYNQKKSASGTLSFETVAYQYLKQWLVNDVSAPLNAVSVKIEDVGCGTYDDYMIKATDLRWCEEEDNINTCVFDVTVKQQENPMVCIERTVVSDDWQGWFNDFQATHKHPRFSYCNEQRPNGMMVMLWWLMANVMGPMLLVLIPILLLFNAIIAIINVIVGAINTIISIIGGNPVSQVNWQTVPYIDPKGLLNSYGAYFVESAGCGREHPAPLIRDYIKNVCMKCKIEVDDVSAPIFFAQNMAIETSDRGVINTLNHHYNACYFNAPVQRGVRRFESIGIFSASSGQYYIEDNRPLLTLNEFLDELKVLYNAEWRLRNVNGKPTLFFQRKDFFLQGSYLLDFTASGADRLKLLEGICFEWNDVKYPASTEGLYTMDAADTCGNNALDYMNSLLSYDPSTLNPTFDGKESKISKYGATKFRLDGASIDYLYDAFQVVVNSSFLVPFVSGFMFDIVGEYIIQYADYALLLKDETCTLPKVIIWDGERYENARATIYNSGYPILPTYPGMPSINGKYNNEPWHVKHPPQTKVRGQGLTLPPFYPGYYTVTDFFGAREIKQPVLLPNFFMFFEPGYYDTMWDWFHWIDDPRYNPRMQYRWEAKMGLCCDDVKNLGVFAGGDIALSKKVKLPLQYFTDGRISEIEVNYSTEPPLGAHIILKGTV